MESATTFDLAVLDAGARWQQKQHDAANSKYNVKDNTAQPPQRLTVEQMQQMLASVRNKEK